MSLVAVIDDNDIDQLIIRKLAEKSNQEVNIFPFYSAEDALGYIETARNNLDQEPDIIILDINMPGLDGWGFLDEFSKFEKDIKNNINVYITSSSQSDYDFEKAQQYDLIAGFIAKPFNIDKLKSLLKPEG